MAQQPSLQTWALETLPGIFTSPFMHWSWEPIEANSGRLFIFTVRAAWWPDRSRHCDGADVTAPAGTRRSAGSPVPMTARRACTGP